MTLVLKIEHAPHRQSQMEYRLDRGDFSVGRGHDADWPIDDPDMFVSRRHCVISGGDGEFTVTDASRGGLFLDGAEAPLGPGNTAKLENGTRLRMGDFVFCAQIAASASPEPQTTGPAAGFDADDFFSTPAAAAPKVERPENLPDPFEGGGRDFFSGGAGATEPERRAAPPPAFDDPFSLGHGEVQRPQSVTPAPQAEDRGSFSLSGSFWEETQVRKGPPPEIPQQGADTAAEQRAKTTVPGAVPQQGAQPLPEPRQPEPAPAAEPPAIPDDAALRAAFYKGLGLDPDGTDDPLAEMEALGARFRLLVDGLQHLLRARAQEKQNARVAATVIGQADVNPLKFMVTTDEAIASLIKHRGQGYLEPDVAITGAYRDLAEHSLKNWTGLQAALRRMIDRFDPEAIEAEMEEVGALEALLAGGRSAKLWQLYEDRYKQIARAAEERFLGEVGEDFRDAYEGRK